MPNSRALIQQYRVGSSSTLQLVRRIRLILDTEEDYPIDAVGDGAPAIGSNSCFLMGMAYDYNGIHDLVFKTGATVVRHYKRYRDVMYCVEEIAEVSRGSHVRPILHSTPGEFLTVRMPIAQITAVSGGALSLNASKFELHVAVAYGVNP